MNKNESQRAYETLMEEKTAIIEQINLFENVGDYITPKKSDFLQFYDTHNVEERIYDLKLRKVHINYIIYYMDLMHYDLHKLNHLHVLYDLFGLRKEVRYEGLTNLVKIDLKNNNINKLDFINFVLENYTFRLREAFKIEGASLKNIMKKDKHYYQNIEEILYGKNSEERLSLVLNALSFILQDQLLDNEVKEEMNVVYDLLDISVLDDHNHRIYSLFYSLKDYIANLNLK